MSLLHYSTMAHDRTRSILGHCSCVCLERLWPVDGRLFTQYMPIKQQGDALRALRGVLRCDCSLVWTPSRYTLFGLYTTAGRLVDAHKGYTDGSYSPAVGGSSGLCRGRFSPSKSQTGKGLATESVSRSSFGRTTAQHRPGTTGKPRLAPTSRTHDEVTVRVPVTLTPKQSR